MVGRRNINSVRELLASLRLLRSELDKQPAAPAVDSHGNLVVVLFQGLGLGSDDSRYDALKQSLSSPPLSALTVTYSYDQKRQPQYEAAETARDFQVIRQHAYVLDLLSRLRDARCLVALGHSLGGLLLAHVLSSPLTRNPLVAPFLPECCILLGAPIEPETLLDEAGMHRDSLRRVLMGYEADAVTLYAAYPRLVQIVGEIDEIANAARSGCNSEGVACQVPPIVIPGVSHSGLLEDQNAFNVVRGIVECTADGGFEAVVAKYGRRPRFTWREPDLR